MDEAQLRALCRCLAFHTVESENTSMFMRPPDTVVLEEVATAKRLIADAGFDFDELYPVADRPIVSSTRTMPGAAH